MRPDSTSEIIVNGGFWTRDLGKQSLLLYHLSYRHFNISWSGFEGPLKKSQEFNLYFFIRKIKKLKSKVIQKNKNQEDFFSSNWFLISDHRWMFFSLYFSSTWNKSEISPKFLLPFSTDDRCSRWCGWIFINLHWTRKPSGDLSRASRPHRDNFKLLLACSFFIFLRKKLNSGGETRAWA